MALMNSTISHEMRNPLNAILSHNLKQHTNISTMEAILEKADIEQEAREGIKKVIESFTKSLMVSRSATNLIWFNVEDILALP